MTTAKYEKVELLPNDSSRYGCFVYHSFKKYVLYLKITKKIENLVWYDVESHLMQNFDGILF
jgi:hypothetical protein